MTGISIGASKNTTGLMAGVTEEDSYDTGNVRTNHNNNAGKSWFSAGEPSNSNNANNTGKSWFSAGESNNAIEMNTGKSPTSRLSSSSSMNIPRSKRDVALSMATSMASSAASATAGAIIIGAKAGARAAKTAVANRQNAAHPSNNTNSVTTAASSSTTTSSSASRWNRLSWSSKPASQETVAASSTKIERHDAAPSWTKTSSSSSYSMGGNSDYGVNDHLHQPSSSSTMASWKSSLSSPRMFSRRTPSPAVPEGDTTKPSSSPRLVNVSHLSLYGGLLSRPPSTITFVVLRKPNSACTTKSDDTTTITKTNNDSSNNSSNIEAEMASSRKKLRKLLGIRLVKSQTTNHRFQVVRDDWQGGDTDVEVSTLECDEASSEEDDSPILPPQLTVLLRPGDFLESVDGIMVGGRRRSILAMGKKRCWDEEELYRMINKENQGKTVAGGAAAAEETSHQTLESTTENSSSAASSGKYCTTTLTFVCSEPSSPPAAESKASLSDRTTIDSVDASTISSTSSETTTSVTTTDLETNSPSREKESLSKAPSKATAPCPPATPSLPTVHKAYFLDQNGGGERNSFQEGILDTFLTLETVQKPVLEPTKASRFSLGKKPSSPSSSQTDHDNKAGDSLLHMGAIPENHWLSKQNKIKAGDVVLSADDTPCYHGELSPGDLSLVWLTKLVSLSASNPYVGITTCSLPPTKMQTMRKTAVAATGSALVGTGAVLMVTPLHPVGHAMAIGGLGVLGTEFEAPKKAFEKAKQSAASLAARVKKQPVQHPVEPSRDSSNVGKNQTAPSTRSHSSASDEEVEEQFISN